MSIVITWILLVSYHYAYKRKWGNENSAVDALPEDVCSQNDKKATANPNV
jgi:hypothetical protein